MSRRTPASLRSARWFAGDSLRSFGHRSRLMQMGYAPSDWRSRPLIAIVNTWSGLNPCHAHFRSRVEDVKRGVLPAGGFPVELPALSLSETFVKPTTMLYRNLLAIETEELLRSHPVDGAVLMGGCDKTTPALIMGATSAGYPAIYLPAGPMLRGNWKGRVLGSGSDAWKYWDERRAGNLAESDWNDIERGIARSHGTCMTMGTASTMTAIAEAVGLTLPGDSSIPAADAGHERMSAECGRRIVEMVWEDLSPQRILTHDAFENAIVVAMALGCSTNAIIHVLAMAHRAGIDIGLADFEAASRRVPVLANIRPSGERYLMEDFFYAGGIRGLMERIRALLHTDALTVNGRALGDNVAGAEVWNDDVIRMLENPVYRDGALAVLTGNLAPDGCVIKPSACDPRLLRHTGPALVFDDYPSLKAAVDDESLDVTADHVLVLRNAGPQGGPGMPEWGMLPLPKKLVKAGVRDMLRISDARMSGTSYGACVLHVAPESYIGGPLALLRTGDRVSIDVPARSLRMDVPDDELARRRAEWAPPPRRYERGYGWMYAQHIEQANRGCDFDFLESGFGAPVREPEIYLSADGPPLRQIRAVGWVGRDAMRSRRSKSANACLRGPGAASPGVRLRRSKSGAGLPAPPATAGAPTRIASAWHPDRPSRQRESGRAVTRRSGATAGLVLCRGSRASQECEWRRLPRWVAHGASPRPPYGYRCPRAMARRVPTRQAIADSEHS